eukprot:TRINITY_DN14687_c0_g1_i2.p1 TRINITY_DN14687_c0_g1~~TRINITY_DN14687_c0_g1_i2.p1  ORF type:complete len:703 (-),score=168.63 TRINITY_DN14687_c0_g1_i2:325-2433(-)
MKGIVGLSSQASVHLFLNCAALRDVEHQRGEMRPPDDMGQAEAAVPENQRSLFEPVSKLLAAKLGKEIPLWQVELGMLLLAALLVSFVWCLCSRRSSPSQAQPSETSAISPSIAGADGSPEQKLDALKKQKSRQLMAQAVERQKLEKLLGQIMVLEAQLADETPPDPEAVKKKAEDAMQAVDMSVERNLAGAMAYMAPVALQSQRIMETLDKRSRSVQERVLKTVIEESKAITADLGEVFEVSDIQGALFKSLKDVDTPTLATIVASMFAPAQLKVLYYNSMVGVYCYLLLVLLDGMCVLSDIGSDCISLMWGHERKGMVDHWYQVDLCIAAFCLLVRWWSKRSLGFIIEELDTPPPISVGDDPIQVMRLLLSYYLSTGNQAILKVDEVSRSWLNGLANWQSVFDLIWLIASGYLVLNTTWGMCPNTGLGVLRARFILGMMFIGPVLLNVLFFVMSRIMNSDGMKVSLLQAADKADNALQIGFPIVTVIVQATAVRSKRDMVQMQLRLIELKRSEAEQRRKDAEAELEKAKNEEDQEAKNAEKHRAELEAMREKSDDQLLIEQEQKKDAILNDAERVFGLVNQRAQKASREAKEQVQKWEEGEGGELLQAVARGEGLAHVQSKLGEVTSDLQDQEWVKQAKAKAMDAAEMAQAQASEALNSDEVQQALAAGQQALQQGQAQAAERLDQGRAEAATFAGRLSK